MFIIDFRNKLVSNNNFSVIGNNNVDIVYFYSHFTQYASGYNVYLKVISEDERYIDKILIDSENISIEGDALLVKWTMGEVSTQCKKIDVQLQFENNDASIIAQTRIVSITLGDTIDADTLIPPLYPKILTQLQEQITNLKGDSVAGFDMSFANDTLIINLKNKDGNIVATDQTTIALSNKVDKVTGKGLSTNDFTNALKSKLESILITTEKNKVYGTDANGEQTTFDVDKGQGYSGNVARRDSNKQLHVPLTPTAQDHAVSKSYVEGLIANIKRDSYKQVDITQYPTLQSFLASTGEEGFLYLYPVDTTEAPTFESGFYRYIWEDNAWLSLGTTQIDLSNYYTKPESDTRFATKEEAQKMVSITYAELKALRDNGQLVAGRQYRITDYQCFTIQSDTESAMHQFDIIVTADAPNRLNENARACFHGDNVGIYSASMSIWFYRYPSADGDYNGGHYYAFFNKEENKYIYTETLNGDFDSTSVYYFWKNDDKYIPVSDDQIYCDTLLSDGETIDDNNFYFANSKLEAWKLMYCLDNDSDRFAWADTTNGKGVIYRMIDEFNNECPYDFKNIMFKRKLSFADGYPELDLESGITHWCYTFTATSYNIGENSWSGIKDGSLEPPTHHQSDMETGTFHDNIIEKYILLFYEDGGEFGDYKKAGIQYLNDNVFLGYYEVVGSDVDENDPYYCAYCCFNNKLGIDSHGNTFNRECNNNVIASGFYNNVLNKGAKSNVFGNNCSGSTFGNSFAYNLIGNYSHENTFGNSCSHNTFGNNFYSNTFGNGCSKNTFGNACYSITFGLNCTGNQIGNTCNNMTFNNGCKDNIIGNACTRISISDNFVTSVIDAGCSFLNIDTGTGTGTAKHIRIHLGVKGTNNSNRKTISVPRTTSSDYEYNVFPYNSVDVNA